MSNWGILNFQEPASPLIEQLIYFHDYAILIVILITTLVGYGIIKIVFNKYTCRNLLENEIVEIVWTIVPAIILVFLALPRLRLLYLLDEARNPLTTFKTIGHQWYWSYEYSDFLNLEFDSYIIPVEDLTLGQYRLLEVDHRAVVPVGCNIRILVTAADVLHCWTVPSLGVKVDAVPGRLNQIRMIVKRPGVYYGQCSEICGTNHSFIPIVLEAVSLDSFINWVLEFRN